MNVQCDARGIAQAARAIRNGDVVIFPTDTVYGMGCNPYDGNAVKKIYHIKGRRKDKALPILGATKKDIAGIAELNIHHEKLVSRFWPGPLTIITKVTDKILAGSLGLDGKIAVRVPRNDCALKILKECGMLVGTSANVSGSAPFVDPILCSAQFKDIMLVDGGTTPGTESTIIELDGGDVRVLRRGVISKEEILEAL